MWNANNSLYVIKTWDQSINLASHQPNVTLDSFLVVDHQRWYTNNTGNRLWEYQNSEWLSSTSFGPGWDQLIARGTTMCKENNPSTDLHTCCWLYNIWLLIDKMKRLGSYILANVGDQTWTGDAAVRSPATPPPSTRPSGPDNDTLKPPVLLRWPPASDRKNDPESDKISKRPCIKEKKCDTQNEKYLQRGIQSSIDMSIVNLISYSSTRRCWLAECHIWYSSICWQNTDSPWTVLREWHYFWWYVLKVDDMRHANQIRRTKANEMVTNYTLYM